MGFFRTRFQPHQLAQTLLSLFYRPFAYVLADLLPTPIYFNYLDLRTWQKSFCLDSFLSCIIVLILHNFLDQINRFVPSQKCCIKEYVFICLVFPVRYLNTFIYLIIFLVIHSSYQFHIYSCHVDIIGSCIFSISLAISYNYIE